MYDMKKNIVGLFIAGGLIVSFWLNVILLSTNGFVNGIQTTDMVNSINRARDVNHLPPVAENSLLDKSATTKACDMKEKNYFEHIRPDGKTPWQFIKEAGYQYKDAAENIYKGDGGLPAAMIAFLASEEHRENVITPKYTEVGIGVCGDYIVQHFGDR